MEAIVETFFFLKMKNWVFTPVVYKFKQLEQFGYMSVKI